MKTQLQVGIIALSLAGHSSFVLSNTEQALNALSAYTDPQRKALFVGDDENKILDYIKVALPYDQIPDLSWARKQNRELNQYAIVVIDTGAVSVSEIHSSPLVSNAIKIGLPVAFIEPLEIYKTPVPGDEAFKTRFNRSQLLARRNRLAKALGLGVVPQTPSLGFAVYKTVQNQANPEMMSYVDFTHLLRRTPEKLYRPLVSDPGDEKDIENAALTWLSVLFDSISRISNENNHTLQDGDPSGPVGWEAQSQKSFHYDIPLSIKANSQARAGVLNRTNWYYDCNSRAGHWNINITSRPEEMYEFNGSMTGYITYGRTSDGDKSHPNTHQVILTNGLYFNPDFQELNKYNPDSDYWLNVNATGTSTHQSYHEKFYPPYAKQFSLGADIVASILGEPLLKLDKDSVVPKTAVRDTQFHSGQNYSSVHGSSWTLQASANAGGGKKGWNAGGEISYGYTKYNEENWSWNSDETYTRSEWEGSASFLGLHGEPWNNMFDIKNADLKWSFRYVGNSTFSYSFSDLSRYFGNYPGESVIDRNYPNYKVFDSVNPNQRSLLGFWMQQRWSTDDDKLIPKKEIDLRVQTLPFLGGVFQRGGIVTTCGTFPTMRYSPEMYFATIFKAMGVTKTDFKIDFSDLQMQPKPDPKIKIFDMRIVQTDDPLYYKMTAYVAPTSELKAEEKFLTHVAILPQTNHGFTPAPTAIRKFNLKEITISPDNSESNPIEVTFLAQKFGQAYSATLILYQSGNGQGVDAAFSVSP